ncbi:flagellar motor protein MotB [Roseospira marina]|uniref:Flagellar motor protein MotB n=1 Tax=Roseospira marina TaxID=140057 RepID=A0A5M6I9F7_9PROT|nr:OmpA family protein [Roseospira marina]KAA5604607.1 flagellar motor protein MotB [Roseospira marina]MBB4315359.1 chemotaxis protein MotB [Roseospira marina]MBB5088358.1 chemotaxis protein MotB [Roseospira marina]
MFENMGNKWSRKSVRKEGEDDWVVTFADMATLLLAFFILLAAISKVDPVMFEQVKAGMAEGIGQREIDRPIEALRNDITAAIDLMKVDDVVGLGVDQQGLVIEFASAAFYPPGSAELRPEALPVFKQIAATLGGPKYRNFRIEVQGHTDDTPISTPAFPSNWELSAERATRVIRLFVDEGLRSQRMRAVGFADTAPKVPNRGPDGNPLPNNQEINRRVTVRVTPR